MSVETPSGSSPSSMLPALTSSASVSGAALTDEVCGRVLQQCESVFDGLRSCGVRSDLLASLLAEARQLHSHITATVLSIAVSGDRGVGKTTFINHIAAQPDDNALVPAVLQLHATQQCDQAWMAQRVGLLGSLPLPRDMNAESITQCSTLLRVLPVVSDAPQLVVRTNHQLDGYASCFNAVHQLLLTGVQHEEQQQQQQAPPLSHSSAFPCPQLPTAKAITFLQSLSEAAAFYVAYQRWCRAFCTAHRLPQPTAASGAHLSHLLVFHTVSRASQHILALARSGTLSQQENKQQQVSPPLHGAPDSATEERVVSMEYGYQWQFPAIYRLWDTPGFGNDTALAEGEQQPISAFEQSQCVLLFGKRAALYPELSTLLSLGAFRNLRRPPVLGLVWSGSEQMSEQLRYLQNDNEVEQAVRINAELQKSVRLLQDDVHLMPAAEGQWDRRARHLAALHDNCVLMPFVKHDHGGHRQFELQPLLLLLDTVRQRYMSSAMEGLLRYALSFAVIGRQMATGSMRVERARHQRIFEQAAEQQVEPTKHRLDELSSALREELSAVLDMDIIIAARRGANNHHSKHGDSTTSSGESDSDSGSGSDSDGDYYESDTSGSVQTSTAQWQIDSSLWSPFMQTLLKCLRSFIGRVKLACYDRALQRTFEYYCHHLGRDVDGPTSGADKQQHELQSQSLQELLSSWAEVSPSSAAIAQLRAQADGQLVQGAQQLNALVRQCMQRALKQNQTTAAHERKNKHALHAQLLDSLHHELETHYIQRWATQFHIAYELMVRDTRDQLYLIISEDIRADGLSTARHTKGSADKLVSAVKGVLSKHQQQREKHVNQTDKLCAQDPSLPSSTEDSDGMAVSVQQVLSGEPGWVPVVRSMPCVIEGDSCTPPPPEPSASQSTTPLAHIRAEYRESAGDLQLGLHMDPSTRQRIEKYRDDVNVKAFDFTNKPLIRWLFPMLTPVYMASNNALPADDPRKGEDEIMRVEQLLTAERFDGLHHLHFLLCLPKHVQQVRDIFDRAGQAAHAGGPKAVSSYQRLLSSKVLVELPHDRVAPSYVLDIGKQLLTHFDFCFSWRLSQSVREHCEVGILNTRECTRGRLLAHTQHIVVRYFIHTRKELQRLLNSDNVHQLGGVCAQMLSDHALTQADFDRFHHSLITARDNNTPYNESILTTLQGLVERISRVRQASPGSSDTTLHVEGDAANKARPQTGSPGGQHSAVHALLGELQRVLRGWQCVSAFALYDASVVRWRFYPHYPNFHFAARQSNDLHSLVLDHLSSQRHVWFAPQVGHHYKARKDPYDSLDHFYPTMREADIGFARSLPDSEQVSVMVFLNAFAYRSALSKNKRLSADRHGIQATSNALRTDERQSEDGSEEEEQEEEHEDTLSDRMDTDSSVRQSSELTVVSATVTHTRSSYLPPRLSSVHPAPTRLSSSRTPSALHDTPSSAASRAVHSSGKVQDDNSITMDHVQRSEKRNRDGGRATLVAATTPTVAAVSGPRQQSYKRAKTESGREKP